MNIQSLPDEVLERIFLHLSPYEEFATVSLVCKRWNSVITRAILTYQRNFQRAFRSGNVFWTELCVSTNRSPNYVMSARLLQTMCYNDHTRNIYIFGGRSVGSPPAGFNDLWKLNMYSMKWERQIANGDFPQPKFGCSMESYRKFLVLFGGQSTPAANPFSLHIHQHQGSDDLHIFDTESRKWSIKHTVDDAPPPLFLHGTCVVTNEAADDCMVMFGGVSMQSDKDCLWCLDLPEFNWWKPTIVGETPPARHLHSQAALKTKDMFSSAVLIVGGRTVEDHVFSDAWTLIRSGFREWTTSRIELEPGPAPPMSVLKRKAVKVGDHLVFFGSTPLNTSYIRRNMCMLDPYQSTRTKECRKISDKEYRNPLYMHILDLRHVFSKCTARWITPSISTADAVPNKFLGPNKPNYHIATVCRGQILIHGDFAVNSPNFAERIVGENSDILQQTNKKWPLFYIVSADMD